MLEDGITIGKGKTLKEHLEVINHKEAMDYVEDIVSNDIDISETVVKNLHYIILKSVNNEGAGKYRNVNVLISGSRHRQPEHFLVEEQMRELIYWYNENKTKLHPLELAAIFHDKYTYIHPFIDGNGISARLLTNLILMKNGYLICVVKMEDRDEYMNALEKASVEDTYHDFVKIIEKAVDVSLDTYLYIVN